MIWLTWHLGTSIECLFFYLKMVMMILHFNALIDNKPVFDQSLKNKQEAYEKLVKMSRNNDHTTGKNQKYYKLICIDLSRQTNTRMSLQINFTKN